MQFHLYAIAATRAAEHRALVVLAAEACHPVGATGQQMTSRAGIDGDVLPAPVRSGDRCGSLDSIALSLLLLSMLP